MTSKTTFSSLEGEDKYRAFSYAQMKRDRINDALFRTIALKQTDLYPHMYISGPPGLGKTHMVTVNLEGGDTPYVTISGNQSLFAFGLALCVLQHTNTNLDPVFVFVDDVDFLLTDGDCLNTLKNCLEGQKRFVYEKYLTLTINNLDEDHKAAVEHFSQAGKMGFSVPTHNLIFIFTSNIRLPDDKEVIQAIQKATGRSKILIHRNAIRNRVRNYDIQLTDAEHWGWLYHAAHSSNTLSAMGLERPQINNILDFIWDNWHRLSEHSVRTVLKMADIYVHHAHSYTEIWKMDFLN